MLTTVTRRDNRRSQLIGKIEQDLANLLHDKKGRLAAYFRTASDLLEVLGGDTSPARQAGLSHIISPIEAFTEDHAERRYLLGKFFEKILPTVLEDIVWNFTQEELRKATSDGKGFHWP